MIVTDFAVRHRSTVYVFLVLIVVLGAGAYASMPRESAPDIKIPYVNIVTIYGGVAPSDVETLLTVPIEIPVCREMPWCSTSHGASPRSARTISAMPMPKHTRPTSK